MSIKLIRRYLIEKLSSDKSILKVIVFGSRARGHASKNSDLDILVIKDDSDSFVKRYAKVSRLLRPRILPMDIIVKTPEEFSRRLAWGDPFLVEISQNGKVVYGQ